MNRIRYPKSPKGGSETQLCCFTKKTIILSIKLCYAPVCSWSSDTKLLVSCLCDHWFICSLPVQEVVSKSLILINETYLCVVNLHSKDWWPSRCFSPWPCPRTPSPCHCPCPRALSPCPRTPSPCRCPCPRALSPCPRTPSPCRCPCLQTSGSWQQHCYLFSYCCDKRVISLKLISCKAKWLHCVYGWWFDVCRWQLWVRRRRRCLSTCCVFINWLSLYCIDSVSIDHIANYHYFPSVADTFVCYQWALKVNFTLVSCYSFLAVFSGGHRRGNTCTVILPVCLNGRLLRPDRY